MRKKTSFLVFFAAIAFSLILGGCELFNNLFPTTYTVLGSAINESLNKGFAAQETKATTLSKAAPAGYDTIETGFYLKVGDPTAAYSTVSKWDTASSQFVAQTPALPPAKDDPNGPGLWQIVMDIDCMVDSRFEGYSVKGWVFDGSLAESFDAVFTYELDIPGDPSGVAISTLKSAITYITLNGTLTLSGKETGSLVFDSMKFKVEELEGKAPFCTFVSGTTKLDGADVSDKIIDLMEEDMDLGT